MACGGPGSADGSDVAGKAVLVVEGVAAARVGLSGGGADAGAPTLTTGEGIRAGNQIRQAGGFTAADAKTAPGTATTGSFGSLLMFGQGTEIVVYGVAPADVKISLT